MDLFDLGCYFAHQVPVRAITNPLLRYSACAYAAKQLGRVRGRKAKVGGIVASQAYMELYYRHDTVDWAYMGAKYYDRAILLLMKELSTSGTHGTTTPTTESNISPHGNSNSPHSQGSREQRSRANGNSADETLAATAILCVYEFLDNANNAWSRHLNGTKSLFDLAEKEGMMPVQTSGRAGALQRIKPSVARKATFWNFARQDFLAAFINESQTRLNTEDLSLWRAAGLQLDDHGLVIPSNLSDPQADSQVEGSAMREDMISNALIWLIQKITNYLAAGDSLDNVYPQNPTSPVGYLGINQMSLLGRWNELEHQLHVWHRGLPDTFHPCARLPPITDGSITATSPRTIFPEVWYSIPMCASTMQCYHLARILLLVNKPQESTVRRSTLSGRLQSYRSIETMTRHHSYEICGISLGRPEGAVRIHAIQPLYVAGQCLADPKERQVIVDLLRGIEDDLGWATDYRVKQLLTEWEKLRKNPEPS